MNLYLLFFPKLRSMKNICNGIHLFFGLLRRFVPPLIRPLIRPLIDDAIDPERIMHRKQGLVFVVGLAGKEGNGNCFIRVNTFRR